MRKIKDKRKNVIDVSNDKMTKLRIIKDGGLLAELFIFVSFESNRK